MSSIDELKAKVEVIWALRSRDCMKSAYKKFRPGLKVNVEANNSIFGR